MYLPLERAALLHSLLRSSQSSLAQPETRGDSNHLGNLSPYHNVPNVPQVSVDLPDDCTVNLVTLLQRHGSRGPTGEQSYILQLVDTLDKAKDAIQAADLPPNLKFLQEGYKYDLVPEQLSVVGREQLFDAGVEFELRYSKFSTDKVVSTTVQRVIDSARFFSQGFFGRGADNITYLTSDNFTDPVFWLSPWGSCPKLSDSRALQAAQQWSEKYIPPIVDRLNGLVPGVGFTLNDIQGALFACPYDLAAGNVSPWCGVFTADEISDFEYGQDVYLDGYTGHVSSGDAGPLVGAFYVKKLIERLTDTTENAKSLYLDFAHDITILFALSAMTLNKDAVPLGPQVDRPPANRKFKSSDQAPFGARMIWERFTCQSSFQGPQVRLLLNGATFPLSICEQTDQDKEYGTCSLDAFVQANKFSTSVEYHDAVWNATCGN